MNNSVKKVLFIISLIPYLLVLIDLIGVGIYGCGEFFNRRTIYGIDAINNRLLEIVVFTILFIPIILNMFTFPLNLFIIILVIVLVPIMLIFQYKYIKNNMDDKTRKNFIYILKTIALFISYIPTIYFVKSFIFNLNDFISFHKPGNVIDDVIELFGLIPMYLLPTIAYNIYYFYSLKINKKNKK